MTTPNQPTMTLEEVTSGIRQIMHSFDLSEEDWPHETLTAALHHLEAGKRDTGICDFLDARAVRVQWIDDAINADTGRFRRLMEETLDEALTPTPPRPA